MWSLWQVGNQVAQIREQLLEKGMPHQQLNSVGRVQGTTYQGRQGHQGCECHGQYIGSIGEDKGAIAIAALASAREAEEVAAGSAVAKEAEQYAVWYEDAGVSEDDGFGPPCPEPKGLAEPLGPPLEDPTYPSNPSPKKRRIQLVVAIEGPNQEYFSEVQEYINVIMRHKALQSHCPGGRLAHIEGRGALHPGPF